MNIYKISGNAIDMEYVEDRLMAALECLDVNSIGKTKTEIKKALKRLREIRPHLKDKGMR